MENLKQEFEEITLLRIFEIEVIDRRTNEADYIIFDISINGDNLQAQHVGLNKEEEQSDKIAFKSIELDDCFSLDENLFDLLEECNEAINNSEFYELV